MPPRRAPLPPALTSSRVPALDLAVEAAFSILYRPRSLPILLSHRAPSAPTADSEISARPSLQSRRIRPSQQPAPPQVTFLTFHLMLPLLPLVLSLLRHKLNHPCLQAPIPPSIFRRPPPPLNHPSQSRSRQSTMPQDSPTWMPGDPTTRGPQRPLLRATRPPPPPLCPRPRPLPRVGEAQLHPRSPMMTILAAGTVLWATPAPLATPLQSLLAICQEMTSLPTFGSKISGLRSLVCMYGLMHFLQECMGRSCSAFWNVSSMDTGLRGCGEGQNVPKRRTNSITEYRVAYSTRHLYFLGLSKRCICFRPKPTPCFLALPSLVKPNQPSCPQMRAVDCPLEREVILLHEPPCRLHFPLCLVYDRRPCALVTISLFAIRPIQTPRCYFHRPNNNPQIQYNKTTAPTMIAASLKIATLLPCCAMRVMRVALPLSDDVMEEKVSDYAAAPCVSNLWFRWRPF